MAKLGSYYGLCPIIDNKNLLGISSDAESGIVIVTLGKNIAIKYRLSDQKPLCSWRTKEKFSSPVLYNKKSSKYLAAFNQSHVKLWSEEDDDLDKLKKFKFKQQINTLISCNDDCYIVFNDGSVYEFNEALESRKTLASTNTDRGEDIGQIMCVAHNEHAYVGFLCCSEKYLRWIRSDNSQRINKLTFSRTGYEIIGSLLHADSENVYLLIIWNDGKMFSYPLHTSDVDSSGEYVFHVEIISPKEKIRAVSLAENYIALYGANSSEEGAVLLLYNIQFKVVQSKLLFKLFTTGAKMWSVNESLLLTVGQSIAVVPFHFENEQLAELVASHKVLNSADSDVTVIQDCEVASWENVKFKKKPLPERLTKKIAALSLEGLPQSLVLENILPDILDKNDILLLSECINSFTDIPEQFVAKIIKFILSADDKLFISDQSTISLPFSPLQPPQKAYLLDNILVKPFSDVLLLPHLRSELQIDDILLFLKYISYLFRNEDHDLPKKTPLETMKIALKWSCVMLDSSYQKLLLSKNESVVTVLHEIKSLAIAEMEYMNSLAETALVLNKFLKASNNNGESFRNMKYSVEQLTLY